jgi:hypothetical protein
VLSPDEGGDVSLLARLLHLGIGTRTINGRNVCEG